MRAMQRLLFSLTTFCICVWLLGSCYSASSELAGAEHRAGEPDAIPFDAADLPRPADIPARTTSGSYAVAPDAPVFWSPGETPADPFVMAAPAGEYRFAVYQSWPVNAVTPLKQLVLNLDGSAGTVWLGLADYARNRWEWHALSAPYSTWMEFDVPALSGQYYDENEMSNFCLLAYDGDTLSFGGALLNTESHPYVQPASWVFYNVTSGTQWGKHSAACLVEGKPALAFTRDDKKEIYFAQADTELPADGTHWTNHAAITDGDLGGSVDLMVSNGVPCLAYEDTVKQDIFFAAAASAAPVSAADWTAHNPDSNGLQAPQLVDYTGVPMLLYISSAGLRFARATVAGLPTDSTGWTRVDVDTGEYYDYPQLAVIDGGPVLAYQRKDSGYNSLVYGWSQSIADGIDPPGDNWVLSVVDEDNTNSGNFVSLCVDTAGLAWISYTNIDVVHFMKLAVANVKMPTATTHFRRMAAYGKEQAHTGQNMSMALLADRPFISFIETGSASIGGLHALTGNRAGTSLDGAESFDHEIIRPLDGDFINEQTTAFTLNDGRPAVAFRSSTGLMFGYYNGVWP